MLDIAIVFGIVAAVATAVVTGLYLTAVDHSDKDDDEDDISLCPEHRFVLHHECPDPTPLTASQIDVYRDVSAMRYAARGEGLESRITQLYITRLLAALADGDAPLIKTLTTELSNSMGYMRESTCTWWLEIPNMTPEDAANHIRKWVSLYGITLADEKTVSTFPAMCTCTGDALNVMG